MRHLLAQEQQLALLHGILRIPRLIHGAAPQEQVHLEEGVAVGCGTGALRLLGRAGVMAVAEPDDVDGDVIQLDVQLRVGQGAVQDGEIAAAENLLVHGDPSFHGGGGFGQEKV